MEMRYMFVSPAKPGEPLQNSSGKVVGHVISCEPTPDGFSVMGKITDPEMRAALESTPVYYPVAPESQPGRTAYVVGIMFDARADCFVGITKKRPAWQAGRINGPGGHIEDGETVVAAMCREFLEETGVTTRQEDWTLFHVLDVPKARVHFLCGRKNINPRTTTDEEVGFYNMAGLSDLPLIDNLRYIIPMAQYVLDHQELDFLATVEEAL
jgi:8-oxo-dGTP diphosphatase